MLNKARVCLIICCVVAALLIAAGTWFESMPNAVVFLVESEPAGATVFATDGEMGVTPLELPLVAGQTSELRFVKMGHFDAKLFLNPDEYVATDFVGRIQQLLDPHVEKRLVKLPEALMYSLTVTTSPPGATVFLNGRRVGISPYTNKRAGVGKYMIRLEHPDSFPEDVAATLVSGKDLLVHRKLRSKVATFYREEIEREPHEILHYTDLAHYYVLEGEFEEAAKVLRSSLSAYNHSDATSKSRTRLIHELSHIYTYYYTYPPETETSKIRPVCLELMKQILEEGYGNTKLVKKTLEQMEKYDQKHPKKDAGKP